MILYEVNVIIDKKIYTDFYDWLLPHIQKMLQFSGFLNATLLEEEEDASSCQKKLTIQYSVNHQKSLEHYFVHYAPQMREEGIQLFGDQLFITRRIFQVKKRWNVLSDETNDLA